MNFHNVNLPSFIETFATGGPCFTSSLATTISGRELITIDHEFARQKYTIKNCMLSELEFEQFNAFFRARKGRGFAFRFRDLSDCKVVKQQIAIGDGINKLFPLVKLYEDEISTYHRFITKPVEGSVKLYINNTAINEVIYYDKGLIEFEIPLQLNEILIADFMFDTIVRFDSDNFTYNFAANGAIALSDIELIEVFE